MSGPLTPTLTIFDRDITPQLWELLKNGGHRSERAWRNSIQDEALNAYFGWTPAETRAALVKVAALAIAYIADLDNHSGDGAVVPAPEPVTPDSDVAAKAETELVAASA